MMKLLLLLFLLLLGISLSTVSSSSTLPSSSTHQRDHDHDHDHDHDNRKREQQQPNFVIVLTDDLDYSLGGMNATTLQKTRYYLGGGRDNSGGDSDSGGDSADNDNGSEGYGYGKTFHNWFVQTPVCCASRAELLTGRMYHNLKTHQIATITMTDKNNNETYYEYHDHDHHEQDQQNGRHHAQQKAQQHHQCMHIDVDGTNSSHPFWDTYYFAQYFAKSTILNVTLNYNVGIFGKHLNRENPINFIPKGVSEMLINGGGSYLNPSFTHGIRSRRNSNSHINSSETTTTTTTTIEEVHYNNCTETTGMPCYSTSIIGNASLSWIRKHVEDNNNDNNVGNNVDHNVDNNENPFFALISVKAPHIQDSNGFPLTIPAPWYNNTKIKEMYAPRTPNYNYTGDTYEYDTTDTTTTTTTTTNHTSSNHHWLIHQQLPLTKLQADKVDELYVSRLKSLLSVDDLVEELISTLDELKVLDNTYILFTSDNGYRLGQFKMPQCKLHPYENDIRVPMLIRGPTINKNNRKKKNRNNSRHHRDQQTTTTATTATTSQQTAATTATTTATSVPRARRQQQQQQHHQSMGAIFSHVHLIPTLLGLATKQYHSQNIIPTTMDGTNLASYIIDYDEYADDDIDDGVDEHNDDHNDDDDEVDGTTASSSSSSSSSEVVSLLIEYTSLGNVVRYQHLVDTYNHSFVALRIMPKDSKFPTSSKPKREESIPSPSSDYLMMNNQTTSTAAVSRRRRYRRRRRVLVNTTTTATGIVANDYLASSSLANSLMSSAAAVEKLPSLLSNNIKYIEFRDSRIDWTNTNTKPIERELYDLNQDPYELYNLIGSPLVSSSLLSQLENKIQRLLKCQGISCRYEHSTGI